MKRAGARRVLVLGSDFEKQIRHLNLDRYEIGFFFSHHFFGCNVSDAFKRTILEVHTSHVPSLLLLRKIDLERVDAVFTPSNWAKNKIEYYAPNLRGKVKVLYNSFSKIPSDYVTNMNFDEFSKKRCLIWIGRFGEEHKNWRTALDVMGQVSRKYSDVHFILVNSLNSNAAVVQAATKKMASSGILHQSSIFYNLRPLDVLALLRCVAKGNGVLLSTSKAETFGLVLFEALQFGVPVISTNGSAVEELLGGETGVSFVEPDGALPYFRAVEKLFDDDRLYQKCSDFGKAAAESYLSNFSLDLFESVVSGG